MTAPASNDALGIGFDLGGTSLRMGLISTDGRVLEHDKVPVPDGGLDGLVEAMAKAVAPHPDLPVGLGIAGIVADGVFLGGPNLDLPSVDLAQVLGDTLGRQVAVGNDATLATLAEWKFGAGRGHDDVVMFTIGTGVGGGIVSQGRLVTGARGFAGEVGHMIVRVEGRRCGCGQYGCLEAYAAGSSVGAWAKDRLDQHTSSPLHRIDHPTGGDLQRAADAGDLFAAIVLRDSGTMIGAALASLTNVLDPAICILGGGAFMRSRDHLFAPAKEALEAGIMGRPERQAPELRSAELGDDAGMIGAALAAAGQG